MALGTDAPEEAPTIVAPCWLGERGILELARYGRSTRSHVCPAGVHGPRVPFRGQWAHGLMGPWAHYIILYVMLCYIIL